MMEANQQWSEQWVKKSKFQYLPCLKNGLHQGETMTFVCVDSKCEQRGLICPVCHEIDHKNHQVMHLKVFIGQLTGKVLKQGQQSMGAETHKSKVTDHLLDIEKCRKNILGNLMQSVKTIAQQVKKIQNKINQTFSRVKKIILAQNSAPNKLPKIFNMFVDNQYKNISEQQSGDLIQTLKQEIKKCTEIICIKNKKMIVGNDAQKVVQKYKQHSDSFITHLLGLMTEIPDKIAKLPVKIQQLKLFQNLNKSAQSKSEYVFCETKKADGITVLGGKQVCIDSQNGMGGIAFIEPVNKDQQKQENKKIELRITSCMSDSICVGVGNSQLLKNNSYYLDQMAQTQGIYGICAMGINLSDVEAPSFVFSTGDVLQLQFDTETGRLIITRKNSIERQQIFLGLSKQQNSKYSFFASVVIPGDAVKICD